MRLNLYGNGINKNQLERLIRKYELQDHVILHGFVPDKASIWMTNMCCIMPSRMEGQSLAMLEAMSCRRMVNSTPVGDARRLILDNETGFLIASPSLDHIDEALERAWAQKDKWIAYGKNARTHLFNTITSDPVEYFANKIKDLLN
ncbi:glycosyltransferase [Flavobacteriaceae bacterium]|nr:glycosyltransferase [Flavobacteriaceae bacterium]